MAEAPPYRPSGWDEAIDESGGIRPPYAPVLAGLADVDLPALQSRLAELLAERGVRFGSIAEGQAFHVDPVPRVIEPEEWEELAAGLRQRAAALNEFIVDAYTSQEIVAAGRIPEHVIETADHFEHSLAGRPPTAQPAPVIGFDLVRGADGCLVVLEDNTRTPSGLAYAIAARRALVDCTSPLETPELLDPDAGIEMLGSTIAARVADAGASVLLSDGPANGAWFEHRMLAGLLEIPLVIPSDLRREGHRLLARIDEEEREVGLVYRRTDEDRLFDAHECSTHVGDLLLEPIQDGGLIVCNAFGCGVADDKLVHAYVEEMIGFYLEEEPILRSVRSYDLSQEAERREALGRLSELVVKPRTGHGGKGIVVCAHATAEDRALIAREIAARPRAFIAQETIELSTHPTIAGERLEPRHIDLRAFTIGGELAPAPLTRFARQRGALVVNSSEGGGAKDTWILR